MISRYTILPYKANTAEGQLQMIDDLLRILESKAVPRATQDRIRNDMVSGRTWHATYGTNERVEQEEILRNDQVLLVKLIRLYYHDYVLFRMPIPSIL